MQKIANVTKVPATPSPTMAPVYWCGLGTSTPVWLPTASPAVGTSPLLTSPTGSCLARSETCAAAIEKRQKRTARIVQVCWIQEECVLIWLGYSEPRGPE